MNNDYTNLKSAFNYIAFNYFAIPFVQGARGSDGAIVTGSKYITSKYIYDYRPGTVLTVSAVTSGATVILTEWSANGEYVGNVGGWNSSATYVFDNRKVSITFKKGTDDITPSSIIFTSTLKMPFSDTLHTISSLMENDLTHYSFNSFLQGYYRTDGAIVASNKYACIKMIIPTKDETYLFPLSTSYKVSIYTWDYASGVFSNFHQTGWISSDNTIAVSSGKALSIIIADINNGAVSAGNVDYEYYGLTSVWKITQSIKEWTPKKVACIGDSLTQGVDVGMHIIAENYPYFMGKMLGCEVLNYGVAGADTMEYWHDNMDDFTFDSSIDTVLIMLGTNGSGIPDTL